MRQRGSSTAGGCGIALLVVIILVIAMGLGLLWGAFLVAVVAAMFLETPFSDGWHAAWDNLGYLFIFIIFILPLGGIGRSSRRD